ncbi:hypothetical protein D3C87_465770 [compost metagenome]
MENANQPIYYRISLQDIRQILPNFLSAVRELINPDGDKVTFLDDDFLDENHVVRKIVDGEAIPAKGGWRIFFMVLSRSIKVHPDGVGYTYRFKGRPIEGKLLHPFTPRGLEAHKWGNAKGGRPTYLANCGNHKSWVYVREIGIIPVEWGCHALFMSFIYKRRHGEDEFYLENKYDQQDIQMELLKQEGIAFKSSVSGSVTASTGSLNSLEIYHLNHAGYNIEFI